MSKFFFPFSVLALSLLGNTELDAQCLFKRLRSSPFQIIPQQQSWTCPPITQVLPPIACAPCPIPFQSDFVFGCETYGGQIVSEGTIVDGGYNGALIDSGCGEIIDGGYGEVVSGGVVYSETVSAPVLTSQSVVQVIDENTKREIKLIRGQLDSIQSTGNPSLNELKNELDEIKGLLRSIMNEEGDSSIDLDSSRMKRRSETIEQANSLINRTDALLSAQRRWTDVTGKYSTIGRLIRVDKLGVTILKQNGKSCVVPVGKLCKDDQLFANKFKSDHAGQSSSKLASR